MKILYLTLKKKWFDLIASGEKKTEYREDKPYWQKRLLDGDDPKHFNVIHFRNGYSKDAPFMRVEFRGITFTGPKWCTPAHGEVLTGDTLAIHLGKVLEVRKWRK